MKRIQEKVKDLVEVRTYSSLREFISDPAQTLLAYHFTDATSEMMAKWLDSVAEVQTQSGAAKALAGYRGVGKSHFLAALGAIASQPELRSRITDAHVAASAQRLKRRRHPVSFVRRGTHPTLLEEIKDAIADTFETNPSELGDSLPELLHFAAGKAADLPFVLIVDTAFDRGARVVRDDGLMLGEIAEIAKNLNIFAAVALDDDIAGADGVNSAIARNYAINYLDQDHLYRIVENYIFPKQRQAQAVLHDIYNNFREAIPAFRWSEQRFSALYPLHPVILEIASFVRLYAPEFALLGFASEAGNKVLGRPANSLVALDEVFDRTENSLRKTEDLRDAFEAYDRLNAEVITQIPVMQRLQAKLVLKGLMLLSLDGDGTTAAEICAAMLIYDESDAQKSVKAVEDLLENFAVALPDSVRRKTETDRETRFSLRVSGKDNLNDILTETASGVASDAVEKILRRFTRERFPDWAASSEDDAAKEAATDCQATWRGGHRRGRIAWTRQGDEDFSIAGNAADFLDWEIIITNSARDSRAETENYPIPTAVWQTAGLRADEDETLRRYHILLTDANLIENFGEQVRAAGHTHHAAVEKIWNRIFLEDAALLIDGSPHAFTEHARAARSLSELFTEMLPPLFEARYPQHPVFARPLGMGEVAQLISELFSGAKPLLPEVQDLARAFAAPLGLVALHGGNYILDSDEKRPSQPFVDEILSLVGKSKDETVALKIIYGELKKPPLGLVREAVQIILAALVAQRRLEFVTSKGDRINRRSLDLQIIWDDIAGVAAPLTVLYGSAKLTDWARILTAAQDFRTIDDPADREKIKLALEEWLADWQIGRVSERFEELPDEILNTPIWRLAAHTQKTFGTAAAAVELISDETISLEEGLQRIADAFSDSEKEFFACTKDFVTLEDFINGARRRRQVWDYLSVCEATEDENIENLRARLFAVIEETRAAPSEILNQELERLWADFHARFAEHFAAAHRATMNAHDLQEKFAEILESDEWWEFESLSALPIFQKNHWRRAQKIVRRLKELNCRVETREILETEPFCACSFRLSEAGEWRKLPSELLETVNAGRMNYRKTVSILSPAFAPVFESLAENEKSAEFREIAARFSEILAGDAQLPLLNNAELTVFRRVVQAVPAAPLLQVTLPAETGFLSREELRYRLNEWLDELPNDPVLLKI